MNSKDSTMLIKRVTCKLNYSLENDWTNIISSLQLTYDLKYFVYNDFLERFVDDRTSQSIIHFPIDVYQTQPVFALNYSINNESFLTGVNPESKYYNILKLELNETNPISEEYKLIFEIESYDVTI